MWWLFCRATLQNPEAFIALLETDPHGFFIRKVLINQNPVDTQRGTHTPTRSLTYARTYYPTMTAIDSIDEITQVIRPFPIVADRVLTLAREEDVNFQELTQLISTDPALSALLLSLANSPLYGTINRRIDSVHRAILILGRDHVVEAVMMQIMRSVRGMVQTSWPKGDLLFWQHSVAVGIVTRLLTKALNLPFLQQALLAGLLHDIGKLLLLNHRPATYQHILEEAYQTSTPLHFLEAEAFGVTHAQVGATACEKWNMPDHFAHSVGVHHDEPELTQNLANLVRDANMLVKIAGIGESGNAHISTNMIDSLPHMRLPVATVHRILAELPEMVHQLTNIVFGTSIAGHVQRVTKVVSSPECIWIGIREKQEQLFVRLTLAAMGYQTIMDMGLPSQWEESKSTIDAVVTDAPEHYPRGAYLTLDYREWRMEQPEEPEFELNTRALRSWLHTCLKVPMELTMMR